MKYQFSLFLFYLIVFINCNKIINYKQNMNIDRYFIVKNNSNFNDSLIEEQTNLEPAIIEINDEKSDLNFIDILEELKILFDSYERIEDKELNRKYKHIIFLSKNLLQISYKAKIERYLNTFFSTNNNHKNSIDFEWNYNNLSKKVLTYIYPSELFENQIYDDSIEKLIDYFFLNNNPFMALSLSRVLKKDSISRFFSTDLFYPENKANMKLMNCFTGCLYHTFFCFAQICPSLKKLTSEIWVCCSFCHKCCCVFCCILFLLIIGVICFLDYFFCGIYLSFH